MFSKEFLENLTVERCMELIPSFVIRIMNYKNKKSLSEEYVLTVREQLTILTNRYYELGGTHEFGKEFYTEYCLPELVKSSVNSD